MDALVMCGGRGTRLGATVEKPLVEVCGEPMVDGVLAALADSSAGRVTAVVSPATPDTAAHLRAHPLDPTVLETPGDGYVPDLRAALETAEPPVTSVSADVPLLAPGHVDRAVEVAARGPDGGTAAVAGTVPADDIESVAVCVPAETKRRLGASLDTTINDRGRELAPTGLNVIGDRAGETRLVIDDPRLAANVNRPADVAVAEALCA